MTAIRDLNANFAKKAEQLELWSKQKSFFQTQATDLLERFNREYSNPSDLLQLLHESQRLNLVFASGAAHNINAANSLKETSSILWKDAPALPVADELQKGVGKQFLRSPIPEPGGSVLLRLTPYATGIAEHVVEGFLERGELFDTMFEDADWQARLLNAVDHEGAKQFGDAVAELVQKTVKVESITAATGQEVTKVEDPEKAKLAGSWKKEYLDRARSIDNFFVLTIVPTPKDAEIDGMEYEPYLKLFFELCDQPWKQIEEAQAKLIEKFDAAKELHITSDDGTDVTLNIEGQTFANSVIKKNIPGSEIFSSPKRDGVNGTLVCKGKFMPKGDKDIIENMVLKFKNGEVVEATAEKGEAALKKVLAMDEGAHFPGEIGIGTNPWLKRHVMNGLLVEKISGSFHIALGACYDYEKYDGKPVNVKNGNESALHWDVTTMLLGRGGKMFLDGELIQENGKYLAPEFDVFNRGWEAVPPKERPDYWKNLLKDRDKAKPAAQAR